MWTGFSFSSLPRVAGLDQVGKCANEASSIVIMLDNTG